MNRFLFLLTVAFPVVFSGCVHPKGIHPKRAGFARFPCLPHRPSLSAVGI
ncbi:hypothetical protein [Larkinella arboricola]